MDHFRESFEQPRGKRGSEGGHGCTGHVALIGCGPGDPELLTLKGLRHIREADVLVVDRLVNPAILDHARPEAVRIYVGKAPGNHHTSQDDINRILVREARRGRRVVRLKGGDPFIFGRVVEELEAIQSAGISHSIVPGITAAHACAASVALPLTSRAQHRLFSVLTGAGSQGEFDHDWQALARSGEPFAVYMGVRTAGRIQNRLITAGFTPNTPVVIVEKGTLPQERSFATTLDALTTCIEARGVTGPAVIFVGLDWAELGLAAPAKVERFAGASVVPFEQPEKSAILNVPLWVAG